METASRLSIDVETSPSLGFYYDLWKEGNIVKTKRSWCILSVAWKWEHEKKVHVRALCDFKSYKKGKLDDRELVELIWKLLDKAAIVIAHNGDRFDLKKIRSRFLKHRLPPPSPFKTVDTLKVLRRYFAEDSNRLDAVSQDHGLGAKLPHVGFKLWEDCMDGNRKAWATMKRYNAQDVVLLVRLYKLVLPWIANHPDLRVYDRIKGCPNCRSTKLHRRGTAYTKINDYQQYQCLSCRAYFRGEVIKHEN